MAIDEAEVRRIARLAYLELPHSGGGPQLPRAEGGEHLLDDAAVKALARELGAILDHVKELEAIDVSGVEPTSHGVPLPTRFRADEPGATLPTETALSQAPARTGDAFSVPKIIE